MMREELLRLLDENAGRYLQAVYVAGENLRRMYNFHTFTYALDKQNHRIYLSKKGGPKKDNEQCFINQRNIISIKVSKMLDLIRITLLTKDERIELLIYQYSTNKEL